MTIAEDASQPAPVTSTGTNVTTASFTPAANSLIVAVGVAGNIDPGNPIVTIDISDTLTSTWSLLQSISDTTNAEGAVYVWAMNAGGSPAARTVSIASNATGGGIDLTVRVLTGANAVSTCLGNTASSTADNAATISLTTTTAGSLVVGGFVETTMVSIPTLVANANTTIWAQTADTTNTQARATYRGAALTGSPGSTAYGFTNTFSGSSNIHNVVEILPGGATVVDPLVNIAEGGTAGINASVATSGGASGAAFDAVNIDSGSSLTFDNTHVAHGTLAYKVSLNSRWCNLVWSSSLGGSQATLYLRTYLYLENYPASNTQLYVLSWANGTSAATTFAGHVVVRSDGHIALRGAANTELLVSQNALALNQWNRIEAKCVGSSTAGTLEAKIFSLDNVTPIETLTKTGINTLGSTLNQVYFGSAGAGSGQVCWLDDVGVSRNQYLGPSQAPLRKAPPSMPR